MSQKKAGRCYASRHPGSIGYSEIVFEHVYLKIQPIDEQDRAEHFKRMLDLLTGACLTDKRRLRTYQVTVEDDQIIVTV